MRRLLRAKERATPPASLLGGRIPLASLIQVLAVAECLNFRHAANRIGISRSSVSARIKALEEDLGTIDVREDAARITAPTLVIGCTHDHMVPPSHARPLAQTIAGASYAELPTGHLAPMEQPDAFAALVTAFLREQVD